MLCDINNKMDRGKQDHLSAGSLHSSLQHFHVSSVLASPGQTKSDDNDDYNDDDDDDLAGQVPHITAGHRQLGPGEGAGLAGARLHPGHLPPRPPRLPGSLRPPLRHLAVRRPSQPQVQGQRGGGGGGGGVAS